MEALQTIMLAWVDEISTKQTEKLNARIDELKECNKNQTQSLENKLEQQSENFNTKLELQTEKIKHDTIKITRKLKS